MHEFNKDNSDRVWMVITVGLLMCAAAEIFSPKVEISIKNEFIDRAEQALTVFERELVNTNNTLLSAGTPTPVETSKTQTLFVFVGQQPVGVLPSLETRAGVKQPVGEGEIHEQFQRLKQGISRAISKSESLSEVSLRSYGEPEKKTIPLAQPELITERARLSLIQVAKKLQKFWTSRIFINDQAVEYLPAAKLVPSRDLIGEEKKVSPIFLSKHP